VSGQKAFIILVLHKMHVCTLAHILPNVRTGYKILSEEAYCLLRETIRTLHYASSLLFSYHHWNTKEVPSTRTVFLRLKGTGGDY
jgi:ABC-type uncharacterized transport system YnjBCD substrate-binding protein